MSRTIWHPFHQHGLGQPIPTITHGRGEFLYDRDGREIVDAISSWWVNTHGHAHPRIAEAIAKQAETLDQIIFAGWSHDAAAALAEDLDPVLPKGLDYLFFSDSGSTAVEVALKMAIGYWHNIGQPRSRVIVMENSYHGDTFGTMSVGERGVFTRAFTPLLFDVSVIPFPVGDGANTLAALKTACEDEDHPAAAFIVEPLVQGAGGMAMYDASVLKAMRTLCSDHAVPFIADEVMTGWGRTGAMFACERAGITPDILCLSKGLTSGSLPLALTAATSAFFEAHYADDRAKMFYHSSSYTANALGCAAARASLAIWRDEPVQQRIDHITERHAAFAGALKRYPGFTNVRQMGTILALDCTPPEGDGEMMRGGGGGYLSVLGPKLLRYFNDNAMLLRPLGNCIYVMPPYCIGDAALDRAYQVITNAHDAVVAAP